MKATDKRARRIAAQIKNDDCWDVSVTGDGRAIIVFTPDLRWRAEEMEEHTDSLSSGSRYWGVYCDDDQHGASQTCGGALLQIKDFYAKGVPK